MIRKDFYQILGLSQKGVPSIEGLDDCEGFFIVNLIAEFSRRVFLGQSAMGCRIPSLSH